MRRRAYHRAQAQLFVRLAQASRDPQVAERCNQMAVEQMSKAEQIEAGTGEYRLGAAPSAGDGGRTDREP